MSMVKKFIDIVFPVRALPQDDDECAKVISEYKKVIKRDNDHITKFLGYEILFWGIGAMYITQGFKIINLLVLFCLLFPVVLYLICLILYFAYKYSKKKDLAKKKYLIYVLCVDILGISGFQGLVGILDSDYSYRSFIILLFITLLGYYAVYWIYLAKFSTCLINTSQISYWGGVTIISVILGSFIIKFMSLDLKLAAACLFGIFIAVMPAYKFVNYRQYDNIQHAKNGEPFK